MNGVSAVPTASTTRPQASTGRGPCRSASAPARGCTAPQTNWAIASAKLIVTMPRPVELLIGETKRPSVLRAPIVTMRTAAAANVTTTAGLLQPFMGPD